MLSQLADPRRGGARSHACRRGPCYSGSVTMIELKDLDVQEPPRFCKMWESAGLAAVAAALREQSGQSLQYNTEQPLHPPQPPPPAVRPPKAVANPQARVATHVLDSIGQAPSHAAQIPASHQHTGQKLPATQAYLQHKSLSTRPAPGCPALQQLQLPLGPAYELTRDSMLPGAVLKSEFEEAVALHQTMLSKACKAAATLPGHVAHHSGALASPSLAKADAQAQMLCLLDAFGSQLEALPAGHSGIGGELGVHAQPELLMFFLETAAAAQAKQQQC